MRTFGRVVWKEIFEDRFHFQTKMHQRKRSLTSGALSR